MRFDSHAERFRYAFAQARSRPSPATLAGRVGRLNPDSGEIRYLDGVPEVYAEGQGGLLDIALPPDHAETGWVYFTYAKPVDGQGATTLAQAGIQNGTLQRGSWVPAYAGMTKRGQPPA